MADDDKFFKKVGRALGNAALQGTRNIIGGVDANGLDFLKAGPRDTSMLNGRDIESPVSMIYTDTNRTFAGTDVTVALVYNENIVILGNVQTATYSIHRDKMPVRTLGRTYAKDYVRGQRTIAGSLIFVQFDESPLNAVYTFFNKKLENPHRFSSPLADEIPPFDLMLIFTNEYGFSSIIRIYGVEITDEGGTYSINDIYSENVMQFLAKDIDPMVSNGSSGEHQTLLFNKMMQGKVIDEHYASMVKYADKLEQELSTILKNISEISKKSKSTFSSLDSKRVSQQQIKLLDKRRVIVISEIEKAYNNIRKYEKTKMSWDMNSATQPNYTQSPAFSKK